ncbi:acyl-CoA dehydrogenase [Cryobacterium melibiosiphilum]|uniref:Acyl-CoA dehydrogenase n=1 Tax=Cryobacterium melibiosiphilum TaxID=995039 RepID=A0A3A5MNS4_9MICO|nr:acyl-CoA dehydrogenase [Cryobacterium melibiosiphilum]RJT90615.1 acyl-CoA dehydrogenase [Cryobacterium melibiosiphilum]
MTTQTQTHRPVDARVSAASAHGPQPVRLPRAAADPTSQPLGPVMPLASGVTLGQLSSAALVRGNAGRALTLARQLGASVPVIGAGETAVLFETLASLAAVDLTAARVAEAHLDALAILRQAGIDPAALFPAGQAGADAAGPVWGVFAAEASGLRLDALPVQSGGVHPHATGGPGADAPSWRLDGTKPWCSLAGSLSHALVTARTSDSQRRLFAVDLRQPGVGVRAGGWVALGLPSVPSGPVDFAAVAARPIGADGWYLQRPGFAWGGIGVAACWFGGAVGVARQLYAAVHTPAHHAPDQIALAHLGAIDVLLTACGSALGQAAAAIDSGAATGTDGARLAARVRGLVARSADEIITRVGHALGPAPLAFDARHAQRIADLQLYVRQHHAERDDAALGRMLLAPGATHAADGAPAQGGSPW